MNVMTNATTTPAAQTRQQAAAALVNAAERTAAAERQVGLVQKTLATAQGAQLVAETAYLAANGVSNSVSIYMGWTLTVANGVLTVVAPGPVLIDFPPK